MILTSITSIFHNYNVTFKLFRLNNKHLPPSTQKQATEIIQYLCLSISACQWAQRFQILTDGSFGGFRQNVLRHIYLVPISNAH
jgi:hypothetical protein